MIRVWGATLNRSSFLPSRDWHIFFCFVASTFSLSTLWNKDGGGIVAWR